MIYHGVRRWNRCCPEDAVSFVGRWGTWRKTSIWLLSYRCLFYFCLAIYIYLPLSDLKTFWSNERHNGDQNKGSMNDKCCNDVDCHVLNWTTCGTKLLGVGVSRVARAQSGIFVANQTVTLMRLAIDKYGQLKNRSHIWDHHLSISRFVCSRFPNRLLIQGYCKPMIIQSRINSRKWNG